MVCGVFYDQTYEMLSYQRDTALQLVFIRMCIYKFVRTDHVRDKGDQISEKSGSAIHNGCLTPLRTFKRFWKNAGGTITIYKNGKCFDLKLS